MTSTTEVLLLHHKERQWAEYIRYYSELNTLENAGVLKTRVASLPQQNAHPEFARLPERVRHLLFFAKPDLVVCIDDGVKPVQPIFALDVTEHVAARDHWIQRFPNLVGCAQEGVPGAFVAPGNTPNREKFRGKTDPLFFFAYDRVIEIHQVPIYIAEWLSTDGADLDLDSMFGGCPPHDSPGMRNVLQFFELVLDAAMKGRDLGALMRERIIVNLRNELRGTAYENVPRIAEFPRLTLNMPDGRPLSGAELSEWLAARALSLPSNIPDRIAKRDSNVIMSPLTGNERNKEDVRRRFVNRVKNKGGDPYTQLPLVVDYLFCRLGPTTVERDSNLVIDLSFLGFSDFAEYVRSIWRSSPLQHLSLADIGDKDVPRYTLHLREGFAQVMKNFVRLHAFSADLIVFSDGVLYF